MEVWLEALTPPQTFESLYFILKYALRDLLKPIQIVNLY